MARITDLPVELLIPICEDLTIDDILSLRLSNRRVSSLVSPLTDELAFQIARNTFPRARLLLQMPESGVYDFRWLKSLIPARLAAIVLDKDKLKPWRYTEHTRCLDAMPAENPAGNDLRARVANGWRVLKLVSNVYRDVYAQEEVEEGPRETVPWHHPSTLNIPGSDAAGLEEEDVSRREHQVYIRAISLVLRLSRKDCRDFFLLFRPLVDAFECSRYFDWRNNWFDGHKAREPEQTYFLDCTFKPGRNRGTQILGGGSSSNSILNHLLSPTYGSAKWRHLDKGNTWLTSLILREGPDLFWEQWQRRPCTERPDFYWKMWQKRPGGGRVEGKIDGFYWSQYAEKEYRSHYPDSDARAHHIRDRIHAAWSARSQARIHVEREVSSRIWYALHARAHRRPIVPPSRYDTLENPRNADEGHAAALRDLYAGRWTSERRGRDNPVSEGEWSWFAWQQGEVGIHEEAEYDEDRINSMSHIIGNHCAGDPLELFDSLEDVHYAIWL